MQNARQLAEKLIAIQEERSQQEFILGNTRPDDFVRQCGVPYQDANGEWLLTPVPDPYSSPEQQHEAYKRLCEIDGEVAEIKAVLAQRRSDGPFPPDGFAYGGLEVRTSKPKLWKLIAHLWTCRDRTAEFSDLADPVWNDHACVVTKDMVGSLRRDANSLFKHGTIPLRVKVQPPYVTIVETDEG